MELGAWNEFVTVIEYGSFSIAAEELCMSQSSLSKHIIALERELDLKLISRNPKGIELTDAGRELMPLARQLKELGDRLTESVEREKHRNATELNLISLPEMAQYGLTASIGKFRKIYPEAQVDITECKRAEEALNGVLTGKYALAFARKMKQFEAEDLEYIRYRPDNLTVVLHKSHPLSGRSYITLQELKNERIYLLDTSYGMYDLCIESCREAGFEPNIVYTSDRPENILSFVSQGLGVALLMRRQADFLGYFNTICIDITPAIDGSICVIRHGHRPLNSIAKKFWDTMTAEVDGLTIDPRDKTLNPFQNEVGYYELG